MRESHPGQIVAHGGKKDDRSEGEAAKVKVSLGMAAVPLSQESPTKCTPRTCHRCHIKGPEVRRMSALPENHSCRRRKHAVMLCRECLRRLHGDLVQVWFEIGSGGNFSPLSLKRKDGQDGENISRRTFAGRLHARVQGPVWARDMRHSGGSLPLNKK